MVSEGWLCLVVPHKPRLHIGVGGGSQPGCGNNGATTGAHVPSPVPAARGRGSNSSLSRSTVSRSPSLLREPRHVRLHLARSRRAAPPGHSKTRCLRGTPAIQPRLLPVIARDPLPSPGMTPSLSRPPPLG